jgi:hypothetical protein
MTHFGDVVKALMGLLPGATSADDAAEPDTRRKEGRRKVPAAIDPSIRPALQLADVVSGYRQTPAVTRGGLVYIASGPTLFVFGPDGAPRDPIDIIDLGLHGCAYTAACDPFSKAVYVSDSRDTGEETTLVALRRDTHALRWQSNIVNNCTGLAVLPQQGVVIASSYYGNALYALQTSDGTLASTAEIFQPTYVAAEPRAGLVFASSYDDGAGTVIAFQWRGVSGLTRLHAVDAAGVTPARRPLAVLPPLQGCTRSHLVVGTQRTSTLLVLALPECRLVHTHELPGVHVTGLGADSSVPEPWELAPPGSGGAPPAPHALVVLDSASKDALVLPWPLPGMPELE